MSNPVNPMVSEQIGGYLFNWQPENIQIKVSRIQVGKAGKVSGEILISSNGIGMHGPSDFLSFASDTKKKDIIGILTKKYEKYDWQNIIDILCYQVQERARRGEDAQETLIHSEMDIKPPEYLIDPFIMAGIPNVIFGDKGVTKSTFCLALMACLSIPWVDNPLGLSVPEKPVVCAWADWEQEHDLVSWTGWRLSKGMNIEPFILNYRRFRLPIADEIETLEKWLSDIKAKVLFIDSLAAAAGKRLDEESALAFFPALRKLKITSVIIAQNSKDPESKKKTIYGSTFFEYYTRSIWEMRKAAHEPDSNEMSIALFQKYANYDKLHSPIGFKIVWNENKSTTISRQSAMSISEFIERMGTNTRILNILKSGSMSTQQIHAELPDLTESNIRRALSALKNKNKVVPLERGLYGLPSL